MKEQTIINYKQLETRWGNFFEATAIVTIGSTGVLKTYKTTARSKDHARRFLFQKIAEELRKESNAKVFQDSNR